MSCVKAIPLKFGSDEIHLVIYPAIIQAKDELILMDCGYPGFLFKIEQGLECIGLNAKDLTKVIITHHDHDHMGALKAMMEKYPCIEVLCSKEQAPYLLGKEKSLRLIDAQQQYETLPDSKKDENINFRKMIESVEHVQCVTVVPCGLMECDVVIVDTKGHMPGHISVYIPQEKTLIAGDTLSVDNCQLCIGTPKFMMDMNTAVQSIKSLLQLDIEKVICYHGGEYSGDIKSSLLRIIEEYKS